MLHEADVKKQKEVCWLPAFAGMLTATAQGKQHTPNSMENPSQKNHKNELFIQLTRKSIPNGPALELVAAILQYYHCNSYPAQP